MNLSRFTTLEKITGFAQRRLTDICGFTTVRPAKTLRHRWKYNWLSATRPWPRTGLLLLNCRLLKHSKEEWTVAYLPLLLRTNQRMGMTRRKFPSFDQGQMRQHLVHCLEKGRLEAFPRQLNTARFNKRQTYDIDLFCYCSMPECWDDMLQCEFFIGKFREQRLHCAIKSQKEMTRTPYEQYEFRHDTRDKRHVMNVSRECIFLLLFIQRFSYVNKCRCKHILTINVAGRNILCTT